MTSLPSLRLNARNHFQDFEEALLTFVATQTPEAHARGFLAYEHHLAVDTANVVAPPTAPDFDALADNAPNALVAKLTQQGKKHDRYLAADATIKGAIQAALTPGQWSQLLRSFPQPGHAPTIREILTFLRATYGQLDAEAHALIVAKIGEPLTSGDNFAEEASEKLRLHRQLAAIEQGFCELQKIQQFIACIAGLHPLQQAAQDYMRLHPVLADRTLAALVAHVDLHKNTYTTVHAAGYASAATVNAATDTAQVAALRIANAELQARLAKLEVSQRPAATGGGRTRVAVAHPVPAPNQRIRPNSTAYCYYHGGQSHKGSECNVMLDAANGYTDAQRRMTQPN